jgi:phage anti-repressor protein
MKLNLHLQRNELVPVYTTDKGNQVVNARELHAALSIDEKYADWVRRKVKIHKFQEDKDFTTFSEKTEKGRPTKEYIFLLDPAKKIAMGTNNEAGDRVKDYFLECERIAKAAVKPQSPLAGLGIHTQRPVQINNSKAVNRHIWENTLENACQAIGDYHREATKAVCGKTPSQLKKEAKAAGLPSKQRTSGREVLRHIKPEAACTLSLCDQLTKSGAQLEEIKPLLNTAQTLYAGIIKLGFTPKELAA